MTSDRPAKPQKQETKPVPVKADPTSDLIRDAITSLTEGITGLAASDRKELILSVGHILQRMRAANFLEVLKEAWDSYRQKGRIKDDYMHSSQHIDCLQEMLDFLDKDSPDEARFDAMKGILLATATEEESDRDSVLPQQLMKLCRQLSSGELLVLLAEYNEPTSSNPNTSAGTWLTRVANTSGLKFSDLVETHERQLIERKLLLDRQYFDSRVILSGHGRLTELGLELCRFMEHHEPSD